VLIVVEHRNLHALAEFAFDEEALRCLDVLKIDGAEGGLQGGDNVHQLFRIALIDFDVEHVDAGEFLEEDGLAFHDGLGGQRSDTAQSQDRGTVGNDANQIAARGKPQGVQRIFDDGIAGSGHTRGVGEGQVALIAKLLRRNNG
jgi:hypothetical protein